jgi:hypothetical protein
MGLILEKFSKGFSLSLCCFYLDHAHGVLLLRCFYLDPTHSAFIPDQLITNNNLAAFETLHQV